MIRYGTRVGRGSWISFGPLGMIFYAMAQAMMLPINLIFGALGLSYRAGRRHHQRAASRAADKPPIDPAERSRRRKIRARWAVTLIALALAFHLSTILGAIAAVALGAHYLYRELHKK